MKIAELKKMIDKVDDALLKKILVEVYKNVPNTKKYELDETITSILSGDGKKKVERVDTPNYDKLKDEIDEFLENAYAQNYFAPNRTIPKKDRPKWRFLVKRYVKELCNINVNSGNYDSAVDLLIRLYRMMCYACNCYLFNTEDPFNSVGISQYDFYEILASRILAKGYTKENLTVLLMCACTGGLSRESLNYSQEALLLSKLDNVEQISLAIDMAKDLANQANKKLKELGKNYNSYTIEDDINNFTDFVFIAMIKLEEYDEAIEYYFNNHIDRDNEITLYCALVLVDWYAEDDDLWIKYYEYGIKKRKIKPRDNLKEEYKEKTK